MGDMSVLIGIFLVMKENVTLSEDSRLRQEVAELMYRKGLVQDIGSHAEIVIFSEVLH